MTSSATAIGTSSTAENFTFIAQAIATAAPSAAGHENRRPSRHSEYTNASVTSDMATSFFTSGACARKFGSRQKSVVATTAAIGPASCHAQTLIKTASAAPTR